MDRAGRNTLRNTVTACRRLLEGSIAEVLQGQFGIHRGGEVEGAQRMKHLSEDDRSRRDELVDYLNHLQAGGLKGSEAVARLVREAAFTQFNRLCAYKMLEQRGLIREAVSRGVNSSGFKFYLADHPDEERLWLDGQQEVAYRHFLEWLAGTLADEVGALFSPHNVEGRLFPAQRVLDQVLALVNATELESAWGEEETIGWIYQYFTPKELRDQARKESEAPRNSYELAFLNQFYTPRYVVEFLTDNTLGRLWYEMRRGDTRLAEACRYLLRRRGEAPSRPKRDPRDIRVLDPACGSGHFLLYCFDLFLVIYEEAYTDPDLGPALRKEFATLEDLRRALPALILSHNLHGVDIDPRAVQIASLALWLRARRAYRQSGLKDAERPRITRAHIVCAEPMPGEREMLEEFLVGLEPRLLGQLVREIFTRMGRADEIGSLLRIEEEIDDLLGQAKRQWLARPRMEQLSLFAPDRRPSRAEQLEFDFSGITDAQFWEEAEARLMVALRQYAERATQDKAFARRLFADDAAQGFAFVDVCRKRFDVVLMNPPFGAAAKGAKPYIEHNFPRAKHDLACAFVERWLERCRPGGRLGAITTRTPLFLSSGARWREGVILRPGALEVLADLGYGVLDAMVETAAYTLVWEPGQPGQPSTFVRVLKEDDKGPAIAAATADASDRRRFEVEPASFRQVPKSPLCYWVSERVRRLFKELPPFEGEGRTVKQGLATADDFRFVRLWTEVPPEKIGKKWFPFAKGGAYSPYYADLHLVVNWEKDGEEMRAFSGSVVRNPDFYFRPGLTWPLRARRFAPCVLPAGSIFSVRGYGIIAEAHLLPALAALGNALFFDSLFKVLLGRFEYPEFIVGALQQLPMPRVSVPAMKNLGCLALALVNLGREIDSVKESSHVFVLPAVLQLEGPTVEELVGQWLHHVHETDRAFGAYQREVDAAVFDLYDIGPEERTRTEAVASPAAIDERGFAVIGDEDDEGEGPTGPTTRELTTDLLSWCVGVAFGRFDARLGTGQRTVPALPQDPFAPLPACSPGMLMGDDGLPAREAPPGYPMAVDWDGILVDDPEHSDDIVQRVRSVLDLIWGERADAVEREACQILEVKDLRDYFRNPQHFFIHHIQRYSMSRRKAPIYWLLQSPQKNYGLWLYYHRLDGDILFKALTLYVEPKIKRELNRANELSAQRPGPDAGGRAAREFERALDRQEALLSELREFRDRLRRAANRYLPPDLDDGVVLNIAPLWELVPWKEAKAYWDRLLAGEYGWSSIGSQLRQKGLVKK